MKNEQDFQAEKTFDIHQEYTSSAQWTKFKMWDVLKRVIYDKMGLGDLGNGHPSSSTRGFWLEKTSPSTRYRRPHTCTSGYESMINLLG